MFPTRGDVIDDDQVTALAGSNAHWHAAAGAEIALGDDGSVIIAEPTDSPTLSCVWNHSGFQLLRCAESPLPRELLGQARERLPIHVVVRLAAGKTYVGTVRHSMSSSCNGELEYCELSFETPLSSELLDRVRPMPPAPEPADLVWLSRVAVDRSSALEAFIADWYGEADPAAGAPPELPAGLPRALAQLYRLSHGRPHMYERPVVLGIQNHILPADKLRMDQDNGPLFFGLENQGGFRWTLDRHSDDPTVWTIETTDPVAEPEPLSGFLIQFSLHEAAMTASYKGILRNQPEEAVSRLTSLWAEVPLKPAQWYGHPMRFYVAPDLVAFISPDRNDGSMIWIGAKQRGALRPLRELDLAWNTFDG